MPRTRAGRPTRQGDKLCGRVIRTELISRLAARLDSAHLLVSLRALLC